MDRENGQVPSKLLKAVVFYSLHYNINPEDISKNKLWEAWKKDNIRCTREQKRLLSTQKKNVCIP